MLSVGKTQVMKRWYRNLRCLGGDQRTAQGCEEEAMKKNHWNHQATATLWIANVVTTTNSSRGHQK
jgi:hypothetical protein